MIDAFTEVLIGALAGAMIGVGVRVDLEIIAVTAVRMFSNFVVPALYCKYSLPDVVVGVLIEMLSGLWADVDVLISTNVNILKVC